MWFDATIDAFLGGEGLFLSSYGWPGRVMLQTLGHAPKLGRRHERETLNAGRLENTLKLGLDSLAPNGGACVRPADF